jgi:Uri superfamily endonuclease
LFGELYTLLIHLAAPVDLRVGALGRFSCPAGWYAYTGSAKRAGRKRVARHLARDKRVRWHVDYLTTAAAAHVLGAVLVPDGDLDECALNRAVGGLVGNKAPIPGFGASDCHRGCPAHLWWSARSLTLSGLARVHPAAAVCSPDSPTGRSGSRR